MPIVVECPSCGRKLKVPDDLLGTTVRCSDCAGTFSAETPESRAPAPPPAISDKRRPRDDDFDDDRPSRRRSRSRREDFAPHRGGIILAMGIMAIVLGPIGIVTGILAWIWGGRDLKEIDARRMDPEGRSMTQIGYIVGIIGTIMQTLGLIAFCLYFVVVLAFVGAAVSSNIPPPPANSPGTWPPPPPGPTRPTFPKFPNAPKKSSAFQAPSIADYLPQRIR